MLRANSLESESAKRVEEHGIRRCTLQSVFQEQHCPAVSFYVILRPSETRVPAYLSLLLFQFIVYFRYKHLHIL
jgi:hypothetical protein